MPRISTAVGLTLVLLAAGCVENEQPVSLTNDDQNPFMTESDLPYGMPHFDRIRNEHFVPAFEQGMAEQSAEIDAIVSSDEAPTFNNTIVAMERSGQLYFRGRSVFANLTSAHTNDQLQVIQQEMAPKFSAHSDSILLNPALFARVEALYEQRDSLGLDAESLRLLERYHTDFVRAGAQLSVEEKTRLREINSGLAELRTAFGQNVLNEVNGAAVEVESREELAGLSDSQIESAAKEAAARGLDGSYVLTLQNTTQQPPLTTLENRALRQRIQEVSAGRGSSGNEYDTRGIFADTLRLRSERAQLLGYKTHAAYVLDDETAGTVEAVNDMLGRLGPRAVANARREADDLQALIDETESEPFELASSDWLYYTEKLRKARYDLDESLLKPYFELNRVLVDGVFFMAEQVYGVTFEARLDLPVYQEDVTVYEAFLDGDPLGLFLFDPYARESKRGGAWMNEYVSQSRLLEEKAVVANHLNIVKPPEGEPTLLTITEVTTLFHEFGHALHGFFSDVEYPYFTGTSVPRDFVEYPSQVNEMWATWPEILRHYAVHHETGEPIPTALLDRVLATQTFNQGFATTEYLAASLLDQAWHQLQPDEVPSAEDVLAFEARALRNADIAIDAVPPRYRTTYFSHIWSSGYSAGYYSYIWSEVLDADTVEWFKENGGLTRENGDHFRRTLLSRGGSREAMDLFRAFRGADPDIRPLLVRRGLN